MSALDLSHRLFGPMTWNRLARCGAAGLGIFAFMVAGLFVLLSFITLKTRPPKYTDGVDSPEASVTDAMLKRERQDTSRPAFAGPLSDEIQTSVMVWRLDSEEASSWDVVYVNRASIEVLGRDLQPCLQQPVQACLPEMTGEKGDAYFGLVKLARDTGEVIPVGFTEKISSPEGNDELRYTVIVPLGHDDVAVVSRIVPIPDALQAPLQDSDVELNSARAVQLQVKTVSRMMSEMRAQIKDEVAEAP